MNVPNVSITLKMFQDWCSPDGYIDIHTETHFCVPYHTGYVVGQLRDRRRVAISAHNKYNSHYPCRRFRPVWEEAIPDDFDIETLQLKPYPMQKSEFSLEEISLAQSIMGEV